MKLNPFLLVIVLFFIALLSVAALVVIDFLEGEEAPTASGAATSAAFEEPQGEDLEEGGAEAASEGEGDAVEDATWALCLILDDAGESSEKLLDYMQLPFPFCVAVLPGLRDSVECARIVSEGGESLMLHQPMQAHDASLSPGPGAITPEMDEASAREQVHDNLLSLGYPVAACNNHEGSLITEDATLMGAILSKLTSLGVIFVDSRTTSSSVAGELGYEILERNAPFIDNVVEEEKMAKEIESALSIAKAKGHAIMIAHVDKSHAILPSLLSSLYPRLKAEGYEFYPITSTRLSAH